MTADNRQAGDQTVQANAAPANSTAQGLPTGPAALRLFVAIEPPQEIKTSLQLLQRGVDGVRWVEAEQLHLTLLFLGNVPAERLAPLCRALAAVSVAAFSLSLAGLGSFPARQAPRVLWIGLERQPLLADLATAIREAVASCELPVEDKPFSPHLTLGRVREPALCRLHSWLQQSCDQQQFRVQEFVLLSSRLTPRGASHKLLQTFTLPPAPAK